MKREPFLRAGPRFDDGGAHVATLTRDVFLGDPILRTDIVRPDGTPFDGDGLPPEIGRIFEQERPLS